MQHISRKPLAVLLDSAASRRVCAAVKGPDQIAELTAWVTLTAYSLGDEVKFEDSDGVVRGYWCAAAGTTGATGPTHADGDATDGTVTWRKIHGVRNQLTLTNDSDVNIYLAFGNAAEAQKGVMVVADGGAFNAVNDLGYCPRGTVNGIPVSGSNKRVLVQEG